MEAMINYEPLGNHIVVEMPNVAKETDSGIIKSESMLKEERDKRDGHAKVVAVSQEVKNVKVGDIVIPKGQGFMVKVEDIGLSVDAPKDIQFIENYLKK